MGVIRGSLLFIVSGLLFLSFLAGSIFLTLSLSLSYDNLKPELKSLVLNLAETEFNLSSIINEKFPFMQTYCENETEFVFSAQGNTFVIPCDVIKEGSKSVINYSIDDFINKIYYSEYGCGFWKCLSSSNIKNSFVLVSAKAKDYWQSQFYYILIAIAVLLILGFFLVEHKPNLLIIAGSLLAVSSLIFRKLASLLGNLIDKSFVQFSGIFFSQGYEVFIYGLIMGIILLILGIILRFFTSIFGLKKKKFSKKEVEEIVKKEVKKNKEEVSKAKKEEKVKEKTRDKEKGKI